MLRPLAVLVLLVPALARAAPAVTPGDCVPLWTLVEGKPQAPARRACDPTREKLALLALTGMQLVDPKTAATNPAVGEYLQGLLWNDDPQRELFAKDGVSPAPTAAWATHLLAAAKAAPKRQPGPRDPLLARAHFGDLEALHAFAQATGESPWETYKPVIAWCEFLYRVAVGDIAGPTKLAAVPVEPIRKLFAGTPAQTVDGLFGVTPAHGRASQRALGALLHLVQDALLPGHVVRQEQNGMLSGVRGYQTNARATNVLHAQDPGWREAAALPADEILATVRGAAEAHQHAMNVLSFAMSRRPWANAKIYFDEQILTISGVKR
jgi:hypothetical protein